MHLFFISYFWGVLSTGTPYWMNPRETGSLALDENIGLINVGPLVGIQTFASLKEMKLRDFLKGGSAIFIFTFKGRKNFFFIQIFKIDL